MPICGQCGSNAGHANNCVHMKPNAPKPCNMCGKIHAGNCTPKR